MEHCPSHEKMLDRMFEMEKSIAFQNAKIRTLCEQQEAIFDKIDKVVEAAERTVTEIRGTQASIKSDIRIIQTQLSRNGLGKKEEGTEGPELTSFLNRAWKQFLDKVGWILIALVIYTLIVHFVPMVEWSKFLK
jgi:hypothetical protein